MKKVILVLLLLTAMLVAACTKTDTTSGDTGFIGGEKGLDIAFYSGAPPDTTPDGGQQEFDVIVDVTNGGEHAVPPEDVYVKLSGFRPEDLGVTLAELQRSPDETIEANIKSGDGTVIKSAVVPVAFSGFNYMATEVASRSVPIRAEICYKYMTKAAAELCIKENFNSNKENDLCQVDGTRTVSTSGAPVQITNIKQSTAGTDKTRFTFSIQNMDTGSVFRTDSACEDTLSNENKVFVQISNLANEGDSVRCVGLTGGTPDAGYVNLLPGQSKEVSCTLTVLNRNNRMEPFNIDLSYAYWKFVDKSIVVQHTPE